MPASIKAKLPKLFIATRLLKIAGIGESNCDARVAPIYTTFTDVQTTILAGAGEIQLHLRTSGTSQEAAQERVDELAEKIEDELGEFVFSDNGDSLEQIVGYYLQMRNATLGRGGKLHWRLACRTASLRSAEARDIFWAEPWSIPTSSRRPWRMFPRGFDSANTGR